MNNLDHLGRQPVLARAVLAGIEAATLSAFCNLPTPVRAQDNPLEVQTRQLEHGDIVDLFERCFSADGVKHHKPSRQAYAYVERELGVEPSQLCLIARHTWNTLGAIAAGREAALIKRTGNDVLGAVLSRRSSAIT